MKAGALKVSDCARRDLAPPIMARAGATKDKDFGRNLEGSPALLPKHTRYQWRGHQAFVPPSTVRLAPVMYEASGLAMNATSAATSSTCP